MCSQGAPTVLDPALDKPAACNFRVPLTCYTCVTAQLRCTCCCHDDRGLHDLRPDDLLLLRHRGRLKRSGSGAYFLRVDRRDEEEGARGGHGVSGHLPRKRRRRRKQLHLTNHLLRLRVRDLFRGERGVHGARVGAGLVLWDRAEAHLLPLRHRGALPRTRRDPAGLQGHSRQGEAGCNFTQDLLLFLSLSVCKLFYILTFMCFYILIIILSVKSI